jgi:hypothetical protein
MEDVIVIMSWRLFANWQIPASLLPFQGTESSSFT